MDREIVVIAHDIRSTHNVGSLFRTCEGVGVNKVYLTGYTPYPAKVDDERMPHISKKINGQIEKTALGAEKILNWEHENDLEKVIRELKSSGYSVLALEQSDNSKQLNKYSPPSKVALILGNEVDGIDAEVLKICDEVLEIPMQGKKESFNVVQAAAMTLYAFRYSHPE